jgi:rfaE bifunctional protein kinase chain/domain
MSGEPILVGTVGDDREGERVKEIIRGLGMEINGIFTDENRPTTTKTRVIAHEQHVVRVDRERKIPLEPEITLKLLRFIQARISSVDAILFEDYDKGTLANGLFEKVKKIAPGKIITVDPKFDRFFNYKNVTLFKPNRGETEKAMGIRLEKEGIVESGRRLRSMLECDGLLLTLGREGMILFDNNGETRISHRAREIYDVSGAGDTVIASTTLALVANSGLMNASMIGAYAAGIAVAKVGAVPVTAEELINAINERREKRDERYALLSSQKGKNDRKIYIS